VSALDVVRRRCSEHVSVAVDGLLIVHALILD
jgi:hypothetical protein